MSRTQVRSGKTALTGYEKKITGKVLAIKESSKIVSQAQIFTGRTKVFEL